MLDSLDALQRRLAAIANESDTHRRLAAFLSEHHREVVFMTAKQVAQATDVSQASVSRFCMAMGFGGFGDFVRELQALVREDITAPERLRYTMSSEEEAEDWVIDSEEKNLAELRSIIRQPAYQAFVKKVAEYPEIVLLSARMSATLLPYAAYVLTKLRDGVRQVLPGQPEWNTLLLQDPNKTLVVTVVFPRYTRELIEKLERLHAAGFPIAAITDRVISPVVRFADPVLTVPVTTSSIYDVYGTPMVLFNLLLRDVAKRIPGLADRLRRLEHLEQAQQVYWSPPV